MPNNSEWELDYTDIMDIFKNSLNIGNSLKSIQSIFLNERFAKKVNYKPYFQRNYVWDAEKASYFLESILLGTEIPPLVLFKTATEYEVIDGRQRYETLHRFINNDLPLKQSGLQRLYTFADSRYYSFDEDTKDAFNNTKLRILQCSVSNEPSLSPEKEDKIKKEIFKRYNSGITPLRKEETARAAYIDDSITNVFRQKLHTEKAFFTLVEDLFLPKSKQQAQYRDKINILLDRIRTLLVMEEIPIYNYAKSGHRSDIINHYYAVKVANKCPEDILSEFVHVSNCLNTIKRRLSPAASYNNPLLFECCYWGIANAIKRGVNFREHDGEIMADAIAASVEQKYFWSELLNEVKTPEAVFETTGSHYRNATIDRYRYIRNFFLSKYAIDLTSLLKDVRSFNAIMGTNITSEQRIKLRLVKTDPASVTIDDIISEMGNSRFLVRPTYQRSEVRNIPKSSYLLESIMLGIKIPPIYIFRRTDKVKEVIDGQQRLLSILGFLGKTYIDENGNEQLSNKNKYKLSGLKILKELNGLTVDQVEEKYPRYIDNIFDFSIDLVEIDAAQNPEFNSIDLFLRLNTKPFPIRPNTFEMWNAYVDRKITERIKTIAQEYEKTVFRAKDTRMSNEELITALAYLDYQHNCHDTLYTELLTFYIRDGHICSRIASKDRITKMLETFSGNNDNSFEVSIEHVREFVQKIILLVGDNGSKMQDLLYGGQRTDQNFYFLWLMLDNVKDKMITHNKQLVFNSIATNFKRIQYSSKELNVLSFVTEIQSNVCQQ